MTLHRGRASVVALLVLLLVAACETKPTDYRAIWSSTSTTAPTTTPAANVPFSQYLHDEGVEGQPMTPKTLTELAVSMPHPPGWAVVADQNQPEAFEIIRKTAVAEYQPTAMLFVFKLSGADFDVNEALKHAYDMPGAEIKPFNGMPSSVIEATYFNTSGQRLHRYNRIVIATAKPPANQRYLVQFSVSTLADPAQEQDSTVLDVIKGFTVAVR